MSKSSKEPKHYYQARLAGHLMHSVQQSVQRQVKMLYELDTLIGSAAAELSRAQRICSPRLSVPFFKTHKVYGHGYDYVPLWIVQRQGDAGSWYSQRLHLDQPTQYPLYLLRRKAFQPAQGRNQAVIKRLVKLLLGLLDVRRQVLDELSAFKKQNAIRRRQIYPLIDRSIEVLENLSSRIDPVE